MAERLTLTPLEARIILFNEIFITPYTKHSHYDKALARALHGNLYQEWFNPEYRSLRPQDLMHDAQRSQLFSESIDAAVSTLTDRQRTVITLRFGLDGEGIKARRKLGEQFWVSGTRIKKIEDRAIKRLRHPSRSGHLREFLPD